MSSIMRSLVCLFLAVGLLLSGTPALAQSSPDAPPDPYDVIADAKATDATALAKKVQIIRRSDALMALFTGMPSSEVTVYLEFFAASVDKKQAIDFVSLTKGKHYDVSGTPEDPTISLVDGPPMQTRSCCACPQAWAASYAFFAATFAMCGAVTVFSGPAGVACALAFWGIGQLPNFDNACN